MMNSNRHLDEEDKSDYFYIRPKSIGSDQELEEKYEPRIKPKNKMKKSTYEVNDFLKETMEKETEVKYPPMFFPQENKPKTSGKISQLLKESREKNPTKIDFLKEKETES